LKDNGLKGDQNGLTMGAGSQVGLTRSKRNA
jgi:hypothetical protein